MYDEDQNLKKALEKLDKVFEPFREKWAKPSLRLRTEVLPKLRENGQSELAEFLETRVLYSPPTEAVDEQTGLLRAHYEPGRFFATLLIQFLGFLAQLYKEMQMLTKANLEKEVNELINVISYEVTSPSFKKYTNISPCKRELVLKAISREPVKEAMQDLQKRYDRSTVYRDKKELVERKIIIEINGRLMLNPEKFPSICFFQMLKEFIKQNEEALASFGM